MKNKIVIDYTKKELEDLKNSFPWENKYLDEVLNINPIILSHFEQLIIGKFLIKNREEKLEKC